jgi:23S rRNA pseudouridine955/2504/2580 synthase
MQASDNKAQLITISAEQAGQRIDNFLVKHLKGVPRSHVYQILRSGQVRINSGRKKAHYKLQTGDTLRLPPIRLAERDDETVPDSVIETLKDAILFENDDIIAINKPSGLAVHKGSGLRFGVIEAFRQIDPQQPLELVHRLDRETSGCLLLAKNRQILTLLHELLRDEHSVHIEKTYLALLDGQWPTDTQNGGRQTIDIGISKVKRSGEHMMQADHAGDRAISHFEPVEIFEQCSLMKIRIETGRTHQIRVHAAYTGHPILGDSKYGDKDSNRTFRELGLKRLFLHAQRLYIPLAEPITIEAPLSTELEDLLKTLRTDKQR